LIDSCLRGAGQTVFANNPIAGSLIIISAFINSPWAGVRSFPLFVLERYLQICARARARVCVVSSLDSEAQVMGLSCLLTSTLTAHYLRTNPAPIRSGLFGYHAWLLGTCIAGRTDCTGRESSLRFLTQCAAFVTKKWDWGLWLVTVAFTPGTTILQLTLGNILVPNLKVPPLTLAFSTRPSAAVLSAPTALL
jgi:urea transporter